jgi:hypothetical protein
MAIEWKVICFLLDGGSRTGAVNVDLDADTAAAVGFLSPDVRRTKESSLKRLKLGDLISGLDLSPAELRLVVECSSIVKERVGGGRGGRTGMERCLSDASAIATVTGAAADLPVSLADIVDDVEESEERNRCIVLVVADLGGTLAGG